MRWVVWGACLVVVLLGSRNAKASTAVPMCDEKGASAIAPAPVLPIRDVRLEAAQPLSCDDIDTVAVISDGPRAGSSAPVVIDHDSIETWLRPPTSPSLRAGSARARPSTPNSFQLPLGFRRSVFRPPRG